MLNKNVSNIDRMIRILIGVVLIEMAFLGDIGHWGYLGIIILLSGLFSRCGVYAVLGIHSRDIKDEQSHTVHHHNSMK